jgi:hypothetical protein
MEASFLSSSASCFLLLSESKYSPEHPVPVCSVHVISFNMRVNFKHYLTDKIIFLYILNFMIFHHTQCDLLVLGLIFFFSNRTRAIYRSTH